jgi:hypothetical protein
MAPSNGPSRKSIDDANLLLSFSGATNGNNNSESNSVNYFEDENSNASDLDSSYNFGSSSCSTPMRATPVNGFKTSTPINTFSRLLKRHETNLSVLNEDSMNSFTCAENSFFSTENDAEARKYRKEKAIETVEKHLSKEWVRKKYF